MATNFLKVSISDSLKIFTGLHFRVKRELWNQNYSSNSSVHGNTGLQDDAVTIYIHVPDLFAFAFLHEHRGALYIFFIILIYLNFFLHILFTFFHLPLLLSQGLNRSFTDMSSLWRHQRSVRPLMSPLPFKHLIKHRLCFLNLCKGTPF